MMRKSLVSSLHLVFFLAVSAVGAQEKRLAESFWHEAGLPYLRNFGSEEYKAGPQNWHITQDDRGLMYFSNEQGMLIYDGVSWQLIKLPNEAAIRSISISNDRIYVGGQGDFGYFAGDAQGRLQFTSLMDSVAEETRDFKGIWQTFAREDGIYFRTYQYIFRWNQGRMDSWKPKVFFHTAMLVNDKFYVREWRSGLKEMAGDSLRLVPGGEFFAQNRIYQMLPYGDTNILCVTREQGLLLYDGSRFHPLVGTADAFLRQNASFHAARLAHGLFAVATQKGGVAVIDQNGDLRQVLNEAAGLRDNNVAYVFTDAQDGLWLAFANGLARVEIPSPLTHFTAKQGLENVKSILRHNGNLFAGTRFGVLRLARNDVSSPNFTAIHGTFTEGLGNVSSSLMTVEGDLLAGSVEGLYRIKDGKATQITHQTSGLTYLHQGRMNPTRVYGGSFSGLAVWELRHKAWKYLGRFEDLDERITSIAEDDEGILWLGTDHEGLLRLDLQTEQIKAPESLQAEITRYGEADGLPKNRISPTSVGGRALFATQRGLYRFDALKMRFVPDTTLGVRFAHPQCSIYRMQENTNGDIWIIAAIGKEPLTGVARHQPDGSYKWNGRPFLGLREIGDLLTIYPEQNGVVWFGGTEGLARYTPGIEKDYTVDYTASIGRVSAIDRDSVYYHGALAARVLQPELHSGANSLRFEYAAPTYDDITANVYQHKLEGFDEAWSHWTPETRKDYTGLPGGDYAFRVRTKNVYGQVSGEGIFAFTVLPPWYKSWVAYLLYVLFVAVAMFGIVKIRVRHLEMKTAELETIVAQRTAKVTEQAEKLQELDHIKSRFFANISHEFRTPLTLILGPLENVIARIKNRQMKSDLRMMQRNAGRLLRLINQLLDLSRLESGKLKLSAGRGDFIAFVKGVVMSFASLAKQKKIILAIEIPRHFQSAGEVVGQGYYFDPDKIEKIFSNLLSNAFKFTPGGGEIRVEVSGTEAQLPGTSKVPGNLVVTIKDTGVGIPADRQPHIFDRFYQVDGTSTREHEGTGIGLALTKELVELHHGTIEVKSEEGKGTEFIVRLPLGKDHLQEDEIVDSTVKSPLEGGASSAAGGVKPKAPAELQLDEKPSGGSADAVDATIILVVDDHPDVRTYVRNQLDRKYHVIEAGDGQDGVAVALNAIPDLVISDVMMPRMDGYQLCEKLKTNEKTSHVPVILLTAKAGEEDKLEGLETGADDYLTKPFNSKELLVRVSNLINQRRNLRERFRREGLLQPRDAAVTSTEELFLQKLMDDVEQHLGDENFSVDRLSGDLNIELRQLQRKIRALTGQTPTDFIRTVRLRSAKQMLEQHIGTISEVAYAVGFNNLSYFAKSFRKEFGKLPSDVAK